MLEGLACFRDRQEIDFRPLELFAISGPTGAGKSTLLDAIIFALYGEIPRVNTYNRTEMISASRERVSVVLDFDVGVSHYRIARSLRRNGTHTVRLEERQEDGSFKNIADQVRTATDKVVQILGLGPQAFLQAVVLPQGDFARFLKAQPRDRRSMLRTLLRLDVYERMRERANRVALGKKSVVDSLQKILADEYEGVDEESIVRLEAHQVATLESLETSRRRRDEAQDKLVRLRALHEKTRELRQVEERKAALSLQAGAVERDRDRLATCARAIPLLPFLDEAARAATAAQRAADAAEDARARAETAEKDWVLKNTALSAAQKAAEAIGALREQVARLHQVLGRLPERRQLTAALERQGKSLLDLGEEISTLTARAEAARELQARELATVEEAREAAQAAGYDPELDQALETVRDRAVVLGTARQGAVDGLADLARKRQTLEKETAQAERLQETAAADRQAAEETQKALEAAEEALHRAVSLNEAQHLRETLAPGEPCPVCEQVVATPPPVGRAPEVETARAVLQAARAARKDAEARARKSEDAQSGERARLDAAWKSHQEQEAHFAQLQVMLVEAEEGIRDLLGPHAPRAKTALETWVLKQIEILAKSRKKSEEAQARLAAAERTLEKARAEETSARERLTEKEAAKGRLEEDLALTRERLADLQAEIQAVTSAADPAAEATACEERIRDIEAGLRAASEAASAAQSRRTAAAEAQRLTAESAQTARLEAARRAETRDAEIARAGFGGEAAVRAALLDEATAARLTEQVQRHTQDLHAAQERSTALRAELGDVRVSDSQMLAEETLAADLTREVEAALGETKRLEEQVATLKLRLARSREHKKQLEIEEGTLRDYELLASDLRSDRFQAYVLEEVFTELVEGASARLLKLTSERYSLQFTNDEIRVVDHDNADETRISDTLSGGETFLTSLALALELSDQVQRAVGAVNLDSLFIDEGFGTLDPDTLALVAETLHTLRVGGRMVGIITHIPELRDEFAQQVIVTKRQGYSTVEVHGLEEDLADVSWFPSLEEMSGAPALIKMSK